MPEANLSFNKRAHPRVPAHIPVTFLVMKEDKEVKNVRELLGKTKLAQTIDASLGGMQFAGDQGLSKGDMLTIRFTLPTISQPISAFAEVAWVNTKGAGVRFLSMKDDDLKSLDHFLQSFSSGK
jgi:hypothetical protein